MGVTHPCRPSEEHGAGKAETCPNKPGHLLRVLVKTRGPRASGQETRGNYRLSLLVWGAEVWRGGETEQGMTADFINRPGKC